MEFTFEDAEELCSLLARQQDQVDNKRRWLASMILKPDGHVRRIKRPRFQNDEYLSESYIRSGEISCEKVRASVEKSLSSECNGYTHHLVQDGLRLFYFQKRENEPLGPEYLGIMQCAISKLTYEALRSVAFIVSHNKLSFEKTRMVMEKIVKSHLPSYLTNLDQKDIIRQLFNIFTNPCSYCSGSVSLVTPVSPQLLSAISHALDGLDGISMLALVVMNRKLRETSCTPKFGKKVPCNSKNFVEVVRKRCNTILTELQEGNYLPKKLAKAMSVAKLYQKLKLRNVDMSQSEFFPFAEETVSLQNNILNALWSLPKLEYGKLKLLLPILNSKVRRMIIRTALRNYLTECLFECDEAGLPDEALRAIAFINKISGCQRVVSTEERREAEVESVLNVSSHLKALAQSSIEDCPCGEDLISLGSDDNDFILSETSYFNLSSGQLQIHECCSSNMPDTAVTREFCWSENVGATDDDYIAQNSDSKLEGVLRKSCERAEDCAGTVHYHDNEDVGSGMEPNAKKPFDANHSKTPRCSEINEVCDETSIVAHMLIKKILDKWLLAENNVADKPTTHHLGEELDSQSSQDDDTGSLKSAQNLEGDILIHAVEHLLPNLPKSCIDRVKRIIS